MPPAGPPATLELPLVRLALARSAGRSLTREMAAALASPDRSQDTARTEIVLADLPERGAARPGHRPRPSRPTRRRSRRGRGVRRSARPLVPGRTRATRRIA